MWGGWMEELRIRLSQHPIKLKLKLKLKLSSKKTQVNIFFFIRKCLTILSKYLNYTNTIWSYMVMLVGYNQPPTLPGSGLKVPVVVLVVELVGMCKLFLMFSIGQCHKITTTTTIRLLPNHNCTNVTRTNVAWTNVDVTVGICSRCSKEPIFKVSS